MIPRACASPIALASVTTSRAASLAGRGSPLICDNKVYQGSEDGFVRIFDVAKKPNKIAEHDMGSPVYSTPVFSNGTLYVMTRDKLYAISDKK